jgi:hypothetical protein
VCGPAPRHGAWAILVRGIRNAVGVSAVAVSRGTISISGTKGLHEQRGGVLDRAVLGGEDGDILGNLVGGRSHRAGNTIEFVRALRDMLAAQILDPREGDPQRAQGAREPLGTEPTVGHSVSVVGVANGPVADAGSSTVEQKESGRARRLLLLGVVYVALVVMDTPSIGDRARDEMHRCRAQIRNRRERSREPVGETKEPDQARRRGPALLLLLLLLLLVLLLF